MMTSSMDLPSPPRHKRNLASMLVQVTPPNTNSMARSLGTKTGSSRSITNNNNNGISHRSIYKAPQATIRHDRAATVAGVKDSHKAGSTRRRRRDSSGPGGQPSQPPLQQQQQQPTEPAVLSVFAETPAAAVIPPPQAVAKSDSCYSWLEGGGGGGGSADEMSSDHENNVLHDSFRSIGASSNSYQQRRTTAATTTTIPNNKGPLVLRQTFEEFSESCDGGGDDMAAAYQSYNYYGAAANATAANHQNNFYYSSSSDHHHSNLSNHNNNNHNCYTSQYYYEQKRTPFLVRGYLNYQNLIQFIVLIVFGLMIWDSHCKVQRHRIQLQQYDEERAHILEQMMWIDKAAKRVHNKYAQKEIWDETVLGDEKLSQERKDEIMEEAKGLRDAMKKLQLRVQLNARERIEQRFGEHPVHVTLSLDTEGKQLIEIALTGETPHAASIFLEQIDRKMWDKVELQKLPSGVIQISTDIPATTPVLEFIESSHRCKEVGGVVLRQLEAAAMDLNVLVLRVHMEENIPTDEEDVCIGKIIKGFEYLRIMQEIPLVHEAQT